MAIRPKTVEELLDQAFPHMLETMWAISQIKSATIGNVLDADAEEFIIAVNGVHNCLGHVMRSAMVSMPHLQPVAETFRQALRDQS